MIRKDKIMRHNILWKTKRIGSLNKWKCIKANGWLILILKTLKKQPIFLQTFNSITYLKNLFKVSIVVVGGLDESITESSITDSGIKDCGDDDFGDMKGE